MVEDRSVATTTLPKLAEPTTKVKHIAGFERGKALCGHRGKPNQRTAPPCFDLGCVVCADIWRGMDSAQRAALWSVYGR